MDCHRGKAEGRSHRESFRKPEWYCIYIHGKLWCAYVWNDGVPKAEGRFGFCISIGLKKGLGGLSVKSQLAAVGR